MRIDDQAGLGPGERQALADELAPCRTLEEVLGWARAQPAAGLLDVIVQDEYTHDVLFAWSGGLVLVFDTT